MRRNSCKGTSGRPTFPTDVHERGNIAQPSRSAAESGNLLVVDGSSRLSHVHRIACIRVSCDKIWHNRARASQPDVPPTRACTCLDFHQPPPQRKRDQNIYATTLTEPGASMRSCVYGCGRLCVYRRRACRRDDACTRAGCATSSCIIALHHSASARCAARKLVRIERRQRHELGW